MIPPRRIIQIKNFALWLLGLLVQIIESRELPAQFRLFEVINHYLIPSCVRARHTEPLRVLGVHLDLRLAETGRGVSLLVEELTIAPRELGLRLYPRNTVRHPDGKLRKPRNCLYVALADGCLEALKE